ncbi:hypothetical protein [Streptomyces sp. NPDC091040]|uniref:hypothetical protein n=1 Tax=Streptomyces sp. NPDC091040 TaxID=3365972 RepID=UPI00382804B0
MATPSEEQTAYSGVVEVQRAREGSGDMGKASRKKQQRPARGVASEEQTGSVGAEGPRAQSEAALSRLLRANAPGKLSLAGAYAFGYSELGMAQQEGAEPRWYQEVDPLDALFLGTVWPTRFGQPEEFANARDAWLRLLRGTVHESGIQRFVRTAVSASEELRLPVDDGELMLALLGRLEAAGLDQRRVPRRLLPETALQNCRAVRGPSLDAPLPMPPENAKKLVKHFWKDAPDKAWAEDTPCFILRDGLRRFQSAGLPVTEESELLLPALYAQLLAKPGEPQSDLGDRATAWALSLDEASELVPVLDILLAAPRRALTATETLGYLFALPAFTEPIPSASLLWTSSPGIALPRLAFEMGITKVSTRDVEITPDLLDWVGMHTRMQLNAADDGHGADLADVDGGDPEDGTQEEPAEGWDERRTAVVGRVRQKTDRAAAGNRSSDHSVERIWNADGSSEVRFAADSPEWKRLRKGLKGQKKAFREKFGRAPGPNDPLFFDPEADEPTRLTKECFDRELLAMADRAEEMGVDPAFLHAWREVGYVVTEENRSMFTTAEVLTFSRAVAWYQEFGE